MSTVMQAFINAVRAAGRYNRDVEAPPACILWPDGEGEWTRVLHRLLEELPEMVVYGPYDPVQRQGPAIWLRCVIAGRIDEVPLPQDHTPIIYLPGVSRQQLRDVENCPDALAPLVELQFRGAYWSQGNTRDWTVLAFLKSRQGGLGLDVAQDEQSKQAMKAALGHLLDQDVSYLAGQRLDKQFYHRLIAGGDLPRDILQWLDHEDNFRKTRSADAWQAFVELCQLELDFHPELDGPITGAAKLAAREGPWKAVWNRFREAPARYPNVPARLRSVEPPRGNLLWRADRSGEFDSWPQWNDEQEQFLRKALMSLENTTAEDARAQLLQLAKEHAGRRETVWAELGEAPLARAIEPLGQLASVTQYGLDAGTIDDLVLGYTRSGWRADDAVLRALAAVHRQQDIDAVTVAIRAVYLPWADASAQYLQQMTAAQGYPGGTVNDAPSMHPKPGECILFVDGLRFDAAKRLVNELQQAGLTVEEEVAWAALPSVTATGKPAVSPVRTFIRGDNAVDDFAPQVVETGQTLTRHHFKRLLREAGWQLPERGHPGDREGSAWFEFGNIDEAGHHQQIKLARQLDEMLREISERIIDLLGNGWQKVRVVTDHGWLLMPGGLPKAELSPALTETKWRRFAVLKPGASANVRLFPWYWNPNLFVAVAEGVSSFHLGLEYTHGGLSLQECLTLHLHVTYPEGASPQETVRIRAVTWRGLRCRVVVDGASPELSLDIRMQPGEPASSVVATPRLVRDDGTGSVVVEDDDLIGQQATLVLVADDGRLVAQTTTTIGGDAP